MESNFWENKLNARKEQIEEVRSSVEDVFDSILKHEGKKTALFVSALVSLKQVSDGLRVLSGIAASSDFLDRESAQNKREFVEYTYEMLHRILIDSITKFVDAANNNDGFIDMEKCLEWVVRIDSQVERGVEAAFKKPQ